jgi:hypothetical protein
VGVVDRLLVRAKSQDSKGTKQGDPERPVDSQTFDWDAP